MNSWPPGAIAAATARSVLVAGSTSGPDADRASAGGGAETGGAVRAEARAASTRPAGIRSTRTGPAATAIGPIALPVRVASRPKTSPGPAVPSGRSPACGSWARSASTHSSTLPSSTRQT